MNFLDIVAVVVENYQNTHQNNITSFGNEYYEQSNHINFNQVNPNSYGMSNI